MAAPARPLIETRYGQMFPTLEPAEVERLRRFGERRAYRAGERLVATGEISPGMFVVLTGGRHHAAQRARARRGDPHARAGLVHKRAHPAVPAPVARGRGC